jgi:Flp pilus assembly protein protease CpaA
MLFMIPATYWDLKSREVSEWVTGSMIAVGIILNALEFGFTQQFFTSLGIGLVIFVSCLALYYTGMLGGADILLFTAIHLFFPLGILPPFFSILFTSLLISMVVTGIYHSYLIARDRKEIGKKEIVAGLGLFVLGLVPVFFFQKFWPILLPLCIGFAMLPLKDIILEKYYLKWLPIGKIGEEEVIAVEYLSERDKARLELGAKKIFTKGVLERAKKYGIKRLPIYLRLPPLVPFLTIGIAVFYVFGDVFLSLINV